MKPAISTKGPAIGRMPVTNKRRKSIVDDQPVIWELIRRFPLFSAPSPMKLGVGVELQQFCRAAIPEDQMSRTRVRLAVHYFLFHWVRQSAYRSALMAGGPRFDLWMKPCGGILDEEMDARKFRMMQQAMKLA
jgi:sRNA-binding protein